MAKKNKALDYLNYALSFGLTLVITAYLLYLGGSWLDKRLGTDPLFMILGVLLAIVTVFRQMINELLDMEKKKEEDKKENKEEDKEESKEESKEEDTDEEMK